MKPSPFPVGQMLFVCCAEREGGIESCGARGRYLLMALQAAADKRSQVETEFVATGCLGHCAANPVVALDVSGQRVFCGLHPEDAAKLLDIIAGTEREVSGN